MPIESVVHTSGLVRIAPPEGWRREPVGETCSDPGLWGVAKLMFDNSSISVWPESAA